MRLEGGRSIRQLADGWSVGQGRERLAAVAAVVLRAEWRIDAKQVSVKRECEVIDQRFTLADDSPELFPSESE